MRDYIVVVASLAGAVGLVLIGAGVVAWFLGAFRGINKSPYRGVL